MKFELKTSIDINASASTIWKILMDFEKYPHWNPFITSIQGNQFVGEELKVSLQNMTFKPTLHVIDKQRIFSWNGKLLIKGLFDGEHIFRIEEIHNSHCIFYHEENFSGILVSLFKQKLLKETLEGFNSMNRALKDVAEKMN